MRVRHRGYIVRAYRHAVAWLWASRFFVRCILGSSSYTWKSGIGVEDVHRSQEDHGGRSVAKACRQEQGVSGGQSVGIVFFSGD